LSLPSIVKSTRSPVTVKVSRSVKPVKSRLFPSYGFVASVRSSSSSNLRSIDAVSRSEAPDTTTSTPSTTVNVSTPVPTVSLPAWPVTEAVATSTR